MHLNADTWKAFGVGAHDHIKRKEAQAQTKGNGTGGSASKRRRLDSDRDKRAKKRKEESLPSNHRGTISREPAHSTDRLKERHSPGAIKPGSSVHQKSSKKPNHAHGR